MLSADDMNKESQQYMTLIIEAKPIPRIHFSIFVHIKILSQGGTVIIVIL